MGLGVIHQSMGNLPVATFNSHQLPVAPQLYFEHQMPMLFVLPFYYLELLDCFVFVGNHSFCEFLCTILMSCPDNNISPNPLTRTFILSPFLRCLFWLTGCFETGYHYVALKNLKFEEICLSLPLVYWDLKCNSPNSA